MKDHIAEVSQAVEDKGPQFTQLAHQVWSFAEMRYEEFQSAELHAKLLEQEGFKVTRGIAGMPTAFVAEAAVGEGGPVIGLLGEYDALAGLNQASGAFECRPDPERAGNTGHGCGHHLLGAASHLAAVVVRDYLQRHGLDGVVKFFGCPAEEAAAGKTFMARAGAFDGLDAAISWHPSVANSVFMNATLANVQAHFKFTGKSAHAALAPHLGRSALDGAELMNIGVNYLREHMPDQARVHFAYLNSGGPSTNVIPAYAEVLYTVRSPQIEDAMNLYQRVVDIARGAALMSGTQVEVVFDKAVSNVLHNDVLDAVMAQQIDALGDMAVAAEDEASAKKFQATFTEAEFENSAKHFAASLRTPRPIITRPIAYRPDAQRPVTGSTDMGDVSWAVPTTQCLTACYAWGTAFHTWQMVSQGKSSLATRGMLHAAKAMAATAVRLMGDRELLDRAAQELLAKRKGRPYNCPIPPEVLPPPQKAR